MKKIILGLLCGILLTGLITGCSSSGTNNIKITKIDSEINYLEIENKKIYLTKDLEQFVLQFKGLGCNLSADDTNLTGKLEIDNINSKDNQFYSIESKNEGQIVEVECPGEESYDSIDLTLFLEMLEEEDGTDGNVGLYIDRPIRTWGIFASNRNAIVGGEKGRLILGDEPNVSELKDIENILGDDYNAEKDKRDRIKTIEYEDKDYSYEFDLSYSSNFEHEGQHIYSVYIKEKAYWNS